MIKILNNTNKRLKLPCFNTITVGRAYELLRHDLCCQLKEMQKELNFKYCRFHGIFHDDVAVVVIDSNGEIQYQWHQLDKIYDFLLSINLKPFVELNPMPSVFASGEKTIFKWQMNVTPPIEMSYWYNLVKAFCEHITDRYGEDEVKTWYFEVWNEPNLKGFWTGTQAEYFELYKVSAEAVKAVNPEYKIGGPASSSGAWIDDTINYCVENNVPIDFVSTHLYPQDEDCTYPDRADSPHKIGEYMYDRVKGVYDTVKNSKLPNLEIHWTEWNTQSKLPNEKITWTQNKAVDMCFSAAYIVKNMIAVKNFCDSMAYWIASDVFEESGLPHSSFSCTYGLMNIHGLKKASYNAFKLLKKMTGEILELSANPPEGCGAYAVNEGENIKVILWNNHSFEYTKDIIWKDTISFVKPEGKYIAVSASVRENKGSAYETWVFLGMPHNVSAIEAEVLEAASVLDYNFKLYDGGEMTFDFELKHNEVMYVELRKRSISAIPKNLKSTKISDLNEQLMTNNKAQ